MAFYKLEQWYSPWCLIRRTDYIYWYTKTVLRTPRQITEYKEKRHDKAKESLEEFLGFSNVLCRMMPDGMNGYLTRNTNSKIRNLYNYISTEDVQVKEKKRSLIVIFTGEENLSFGDEVLYTIKNKLDNVGIVPVFSLDEKDECKCMKYVDYALDLDYCVTRDTVLMNYILSNDNCDIIGKEFLDREIYYVNFLKDSKMIKYGSDVEINFNEIKDTELISDFIIKQFELS